MRLAMRLLVLLGLSACASPPTLRHSGPGSGVECSLPRRVRERMAALAAARPPISRASAPS